MYLSGKSFATINQPVRVTKIALPIGVKGLEGVDRFEQMSVWEETFVVIDCTFRSYLLPPPYTHTHTTANTPEQCIIKQNLENNF